MWTWSPEESRFGDLVWVVRAQGQVPAWSNASIAGAGGGKECAGQTVRSGQRWVRGRVGQAIGVVCFEPS